VDKAPEAFRTISEVAIDLNVPQHVLRFWESRFREIKPMKRGGGRRYYRPEDIDLLRGIRHLLYGEGYTIRGVQRILKEQGAKFVAAVWHPGAPQPPGQSSVDDADAEADFVAEEPDTRAAVPPVTVAQASARASGPHIAGPQPAGTAEPDRRRGLLSVLPSLLADDDDRPAQMDPEVATDVRLLPQRFVRPSVAPSGMLREDLRRLQAALHELSECRRLIDLALGEMPQPAGA
jgi:DNA-binding transcriptional MerR regulator